MPAHPEKSRRFSLRDWRSRFNQQVSERFMVRVHMAAMLTVVTFVGVIANTVLARLGVTSMGLRYPLAVLVSYLAFFVMVRLWIAMVHESSPSALREPALAAALISTAAAGQPRTGMRADRVQQVADGIDLTLESADAVEGGVDLAGGVSGVDDGVVVVLAIAFVLAVVFAGVWLVWQAPLILTEAAFSAVLAGALQRAAPGADAAHWARKVFGRTVVAFVVVTFFAFLAGFGAQAHCPEATSFKAALVCDVR